MKHTPYSKPTWEIMWQIGYEPGTGLGKRKQGRLHPIPIQECMQKQGLGYSLEEDVLNLRIDPKRLPVFIPGPTRRSKVQRTI